MNPINRKTAVIFTSLMILLILACNATFTVGYPTPTIVPPTQIPTETAVPLSGQVTVVSQPYIESGQEPAFTITAQIPQLIGSDDSRVQSFNYKLDEMVQKEIALFREEFKRGPIVEVSTSSFLEVTYDVISQYDDIWSLKFFYSFYNNGAAHPGDFSQTINYDLEAGRELTLEDLFLPTSKYLEMISNYCINELRKKAYSDSFTTGGASPTTDNYRNWNVTPDGLMVTFDTYQVAPGAAGPQIILVPYIELETLVDPLGPLGGFIR